MPGYPAERGRRGTPPATGSRRGKKERRAPGSAKSAVGSRESERSERSEKRLQLVSADEQPVVTRSDNHRRRIGVEGQMNQADKLKQELCEQLSGIVEAGKARLAREVQGIATEIGAGLDGLFKDLRAAINSDVEEQETKDDVSR